MINDIIDCIALLEIIFVIFGYSRAWILKKIPKTSVAVGFLGFMVVFCFFMVSRVEGCFEMAEDAVRFMVTAGVEGNSVAES
jgi:hypothetical protein